MFLGTLFPQGGTYEELENAFGTSLYLKFAPLGLFNIFHSWYFITVSIVLYLNLLLCTLRGYLQERKKLTVAFGKSENERKMKVEGGFSMIEGVLRDRKYRFKKIWTRDKDVSLVGVKGMRRRFVSIYYHFFLAVTIVGFLISAFTRFDGFISMEVGDKRKIPRQSEEMGIYKKFMKLDKEKVDSVEVELSNYEMEYVWFKNDYYPKDYKSTLAVSYKNSKKLRTIEVNKPLTFKGLTLYQMDYTQNFDVSIDDTMVHLSSGKKFTIDGIKGSFKINTVYVGRLFTDENVSEIVPNCKLYYLGEEGKKYKKIGNLILDKSVTVMGRGMILKNTREVSGIYYRRDNGVPVLYISFLFFTVGLFLRVFFPTYEIRVRYEKSTHEVSLTGTGSGLAAYIDEEIDEILRSLKGITN